MIQEEHIGQHVTVSLKLKIESHPSSIGGAEGRVLRSFVSADFAFDDALGWLVH
jgi:hypothetical protein